jgi:hypothetical protein
LGGKVEALEKLCGWGKETLTAEELNNVLLLAKDNEVRTTRQVAAQNSYVVLCEELWDWG